MKIAPFIRAIEQHNSLPRAQNVEHVLVHTGQHYDDRMSKNFFESLGIPEADINLGVGSGSHAEQVGRTMIEFEKVLKYETPDWVVVVGDVNATCACSITAKKERIKLAHIEAGLRSRDMNMPEEINRLVTDRLSDLLLTPCKISTENLKSEGVSDERIRFVGNIMIDTLEAQRKKASQLNLNDILTLNHLSPDCQFPTFGLKNYAVLTLHRPSNVDQRATLEPLVRFFCDEVAKELPLIWAMHPRSKERLKEFGLFPDVVSCENIILLNPLGYHELLRLNMDATIMLTDSGGLQEECCVLGTPCITLRENTERPITLREHGGASVLVGNNIERIRAEFKKSLSSERKPKRPELWDGQTAMRCIEAILSC